MNKGRKASRHATAMVRQAREHIQYSQILISESRRSIVESLQLLEAFKPSFGIPPHRYVVCAPAHASQMANATGVTPTDYRRTERLIERAVLRKVRT
jgi:hypothetical protein